MGALLIIFLLGMGLRLYELDATSLWGDELYTATRIQVDLSSTIDSVATAGDNPPLSFVIVGLLVNLLGGSDFVYRFASAFLGSLSVLLTYKAGEMLWTRKVGLVGSFLLAVNAYHIRYSQFARHYAITVFLVLLSLILFLKALETGRRGQWLGFALTAALSIYNHYFAFLALGALAIYGTGVIAASGLAHAKSPDSANGTHAPEHLPDSRRQAMRFACSLGLVALLFAPWLPSMLGHIYGPIGWKGFGGAAGMEVHKLFGYVRLWLTDYAGMDGPLALAFLALFLLGLAHSKRAHAFFTALWAGVPLLFSLTVLSSKLAAPEYSIFVLPVYLLALGRGGLSVASVLQRALSRFARKRDEAGPITALLVVLAFAALSVAPLREYHFVRPQEDWRGSARYLADNLLPQDLVLADGAAYGGGRDSARVRMGLSRYLQAHGVTGTPILGVDRGLWKDLQGLLEQDPGRVWAALWYSATAPSWEGEAHSSLVDFPGVLIIRPPELSGDLFRDTVSMLHVLLDLMPTQEGCFDVHLALADLYLRTGRLEDAEFELEKARAVQPDHPRAARDLRQAFVDFERVAQPMQDVTNRAWYNLGQVVALLGYEIRAPSTASSQSVDITLWWQALGDMDLDYTAFVHLVDYEGRILAQEDRLLQQLDLPTSGWLPGGVAKEEYHLQLGPDTAPGDYVVKVGVYYWETGERLPAWDEHGRRLTDDTIEVGTIGIVQ